MTFEEWWKNCCTIAPSLTHDLDANRMAEMGWQASRTQTIKECLPYMRHKEGCKKLIAPVPDYILMDGQTNEDEECTCGLEQVRGE